MGWIMDVMSTTRTVHRLGQVGSSLGLTRTQPALVGWPKIWPVLDRTYRSNPSVRAAGWVGRICRFGGFGHQIEPILGFAWIFFLVLFLRAFLALINGELRSGGWEDLTQGGEWSEEENIPEISKWPITSSIKINKTQMGNKEITQIRSPPSQKTKK